MSAARLDLDWQVEQHADNVAVTYVAPDQPHLLRPLGRTRSPARCPECESVVYSRRHRLCGVCNRPLPENVLFSETESQRVESLLEIERRRHRKWMEQREGI